jgi:hypothetical protein
VAEQSFANHAHIPWLTNFSGAFAITALVLLYGHRQHGWPTEGLAFTSLAMAVIVLVAISRLYTVALQDRIIVLEMKVRCAELLPAGQDANLAKLGKKQIVALRFASDEELGALLERAARENMTPKDIKASIRTWRPDPYRT